VIRVLATDTTLWTDDVWVVDSTQVRRGLLSTPSATATTNAER
jgi:hypothetical protein